MEKTPAEEPQEEEEGDDTGKLWGLAQLQLMIEKCIDSRNVKRSSEFKKILFTLTAKILAFNALDTITCTQTLTDQNECLLCA